jgi:hypothetical protein
MKDQKRKDGRSHCSSLHSTSGTEIPLDPDSTATLLRTFISGLHCPIINRVRACRRANQLSLVTRPLESPRGKSSKVPGLRAAEG